MLTDMCLIGGVRYSCQFDRVGADELEMLGSTFTLTLEERDMIAAAVVFDTEIGRIYSEFDLPVSGPYKVKIIRRDLLGHVVLGLERQ